MNIEQRIDDIFERWELQPHKKRMFGGIAWLLSGKMACATLKDGAMIVRVPDELRGHALGMPHVRPAVMGGRPMKNWVMIVPEDLSGAAIEPLLEIGRDCALRLSGDDHA